MMEYDGAGCGGIVTVGTTDDDLRARGYSEAAIAEVRDFQAFLTARGNLEFHGHYQEWRAARSEEKKPKEGER